MEAQKVSFRNKGGRPKKVIKGEYLLALKCSLLEKMTIAAKAKKVNLTVSEYLRQMALTGRIDMKQKSLPREILLLTATREHIAANLNQIAKKRNSYEELTALERAELMQLSKEIKEQNQKIKDYLK
jgi:hypothetical protein